jgi:hypothetical protein
LLLQVQSLDKVFIQAFIQAFTQAFTHDEADGSTVRRLRNT